MRSRRDDSMWARLAAEREERRQFDEARMCEYSPYRAVDGCHHASIVERTCDYQAPPNLDDDGRVFLPNFVIRARRFECAACGAGVWPADDSVRQNAPRRPRCVLPHCDCLTTESVA